MSLKLSFNGWNRFVRSLSDELTLADIKSIKFICKEIVPAGLAEQITDALSLLTKLEELDLFNQNDVSQLVEIMGTVNRRDLAIKIENYVSQSKTKEKSSAEDAAKEDCELDGASAVQPNANPYSAASFVQPASTPILPPLLSPDHFRKKPSVMTTACNASLSGPEEYQFNNIPRGKCIIISNSFDEGAVLKGGKILDRRPGTEVDVESLTATFEWLNFDVYSYFNKSKVEMENIMSHVASHDHGGYDCFVCCILSHGFEGGVYGNDGGMIVIQDLIAHFCADKCRSMIQKPKLFFIQACQGDQDNLGVSVLQADSPAMPPPVAATPPCQFINREIPADADMLFFMATTPGTVAWRDRHKGSWFVECLCKVIQTHAEIWSLGDMLLEVNKKMSEKEDSAPEGGFAKQMSDAGRNTLRKKLFFKPQQPFTPTVRTSVKLPVESPSDNIYQDHHL